MKSRQIFDPDLCCSSGVCGADVDQALVDFAADLDCSRAPTAAGAAAPGEAKCC